MSKTHAGGPNTAAGKARSAQNARRHGLACCAALDPALAPEIEALALAFAGPGADVTRRFHARRVAEAEVDLRRIRLAPPRTAAPALRPTQPADRPGLDIPLAPPEGRRPAR